MRRIETTPISEETLQQVARAFDPARLVQARQLAKATKAQLQESVGVTATAIGQYERGEVRPRADTVAQLAKALAVPVGFFAYGRPRVPLEIAQASFRRLRATSVLQQQQAVAYAEQVWELSAYLEEHVEFPELDLPPWAWADETELPASIDPVSAARSLREHWGLGMKPIRHLVAEIERHGILVVLFSLREEGGDQKRHIDAFSTIATPRPMIVLTPDKADDVMRHRFSAAHELGHIVLHRWHQTRDAHMEREADAFAAEFLTPRDEIGRELPRRFNLSRLQEIGLRWGVSVKSLVFRSKELELISEATARRAYLTLTALTRDGIIRSESIARYAGEVPDLLKNAVALLESVGITVAEIARALQWSPAHVRKIAGIDDPKPRLSLVPPLPSDDE
ncbi:helix-turn-helix domain-containing protein [Cryobacterium zongtaii]|uniref:helix-turn-helix domain-containing protein n=1 Tax=Cryobacterium zongtaii TaxID=1259217 RepID=UPI001A9FCDDE|nr:XRE family transcriptional regulator [Cryobacterium zongtaii]